MIKLVATDLDGTLLNSKGKLTHRTIEVFNELKKRQYRIVIASGRTAEEIVDIVGPLGIMDYEHAYLIAYNGVSTLQTNPYHVMNEMMIHPNETRELARTLAEKKMKIHIFARNKLFVSHDIEYILNISATAKLEIIRINMLHYKEEVEAYKVLIFDDENKVNQFRSQIERDLFHRFNIFKSSKQLLEIVHLEGSKGDAVRRLCDSLGILPDEVMAFGDEENDLSMIEFAGFGVAMANAKSMVKAKAEITTLSNDFDGVAEVIQHYILDKEMVF